MRGTLLLTAMLWTLPGCDTLLEQATDRVGSTAGGWTTSAHPCAGNRTDALLWEDEAAWVGCGTTTTGYGLFRSTDDGATWSAPATEPAGLLDAFRVSSIQRADDGWLYVAGIHTEGAQRVVRLDTSAEPARVEEVFGSTQQLWNSFHVGTYRRLSSGFAVAESLTGAELAFRTADEAPWQDGYGWWSGSSSYQILDLVVHDDRLYGAGSTIIQPPTVFLPPDEALTDGFQAEAVALADVRGELWGLDVDDDGILAGGVDQDADVGLIFWGPLDGRNAEAWQAYRLSETWPDQATWVRGVCRDGDRFIAVGEFPSRSKGLVLASDDGGQTFADLTPDDVPPLHRCVIRKDGRLAVAGADGWFGVHAP